MTSDKGHVTSRRELLAEAGRWALVAGLAGGVFWLTRKGAAPEVRGQHGRPCCPRIPAACGRCPALAGCRLPQAVSAIQGTPYFFPDVRKKVMVSPELWEG